MNKKLLVILCLPSTALPMKLRLSAFRALLFFLLYSNYQLVFSQQSGSASLSSADTNQIDTNYVKFYKDRLIIGLWQSERSFNMTIDQKMLSPADSTAINYIANSNHVSGISLDYDIIGFAFGYKSVAGDTARTGKSDYLDLGLNINTRRLRLENSYKRYTGFYDNNSDYYIHPFTKTTRYFQNPSMNLRVTKAKLVYTFKTKKFALGAAYANAKRQVKSKGSWILVGNFYALNLFSDSSIIPPLQRPNYGILWDGLKRMNVYAYSAGFGGTYTVVFWKKFYFNFLASFGIESQYRHFYISPENTRYTYWKTQSAVDWRTSLGYNGKRFFVRASTIYDINNYDSKALNFEMKFIAGSFDLGYRFNFKAPKPYRKFQESKI